MKRVVKRTVLAALAMALVAPVAQGQQVTFYKDVMPILQENCQTCHRASGLNLSGMVAPMAFSSYEDVRPWARAIVKAVNDKSMPPWGATEEFHGVFRNERSLTKEEIDTINTWVQQRAPRGNPADAPEPVEFPDTGWNFGEPDMVVDFPEPFFVSDDVQDLYHNVTVKLSEEQLPEDKWIRSVEFKPGSGVVHHIIGYASVPGAGAGGDTEGRETRGMLGGNAPGTDQAMFPEGYGILLKKGSEVTFAMHYHKESGPGTGSYDSSQIGFQFHDKPATHPVDIFPIAYRNFEIPPYHENWRVGASHTFEEDTDLMGMMPHMHLRGSKAKYTAFYPDGTSEVLLNVPEYDFNWQIAYEYPEPKVLPAGTRVEMEFYFTNTEERGELAGINPARPVRFGGPTTDEMDLAWVTTAPSTPIETSTGSGDD